MGTERIPGKTRTFSPSGGRIIGISVCVLSVAAGALGSAVFGFGSVAIATHGEIPFFRITGMATAEAATATPRSTILDRQIEERKREDAAESHNTCFDYYHFPSVVLDIKSVRDRYGNDEPIRLVGSVFNDNAHAIVDGVLIARISRLRKGNAGNDIIEEWEAASGMNIPAKGSVPVRISYSSNNLPAGTYVLTTYFTIQGKFNFAGLSFTDDIHGGYATFAVEKKQLPAIRFGRDAVTVDGSRYRLYGFYSRIFSSTTEEVALSVPIEYSGAESATLPIHYDLYRWDAASPANLLKSWDDSVTLKPKTGAKLNLKLNIAEHPVYYLKIKTALRGEKAEAHIRFVKEGFEPRLNDVGVDAFPVPSGAPVTMFACFHNTGAGGRAEVGTVTLELKDGNGKVVDTARYEGPISGMDAITKRMKSLANRDAFSLVASLEANGRVIEQTTVVYDCAKFNPSLCEDTSRGTAARYAAGLLALAVALIVIRFVAKRRRIADTNALENRT